MCQYCGSTMISKCGPLTQWHWAHKTRVQCDHWWEPETAWHRKWKNQFPKSWREKVRFNNSGEKHIADLWINQKRVVEFQHSYLRQADLESREEFYDDMVWIVDGLRYKAGDRRNKPDAGIFEINLCRKIREIPLTYTFNWISRCKLFERWILAKKPVFMDFGGNNLWRLVDFRPSTQMGIVGPIGRQYLIQDLQNGKPIARIV